MSQLAARFADEEGPWYLRPLPMAVFSGLAVAAVIAGIVAVWATSGGFDRFQAALGSCPTPFCDFSRHYFPMAKEIESGHGPVGGFHHPPFFAILLSPLAWLGPGPALAVWGGIQFVGFGALALLPLTLAAPRSRFTVLSAGYAFLLTISVPWLHAIAWGQVSSLLTVAILAAYLAHRQERSLWGGVILGAATAIKYYPALFLIPLVRAGSRRLAVGWVVGCVGALAVLPILFLGPRSTIEFYREIAVRAAKISTAQDVSSQYLPHVAARWSAWVTGGSEIGAAESSRGRWDAEPRLGRAAQPIRLVATTLGWVLLLVHLAIARRLWRQRRAMRELWAFLWVGCSLPLVLPTSWPHYLLHLPIAQWFLLDRIAQGDRVSPARSRTALILVLASISLSIGPTIAAFGSWSRYAFFGAPLGADLALVAAGYCSIARSTSELRKE